MDDNEDILHYSRFWIQRVLVPIMVLVGVTGNFITIIILTRKRMRCSTNTYLTALAIADIIYLVFVLILSFSHYTDIHKIKYELYWRFFGLSHWLCDAASSTSVWLTVAFTIERYIAVCYPIKGKILCTENRAKTVIVLIAILCIFTTASTAFEYQLTLDENCLDLCQISPKNTNVSKARSNSSIENIESHQQILPYHITINSTNYTIGFSKDIYDKLNTILTNKNCSSNESHHIFYIPIIPIIGNISNNTNSIYGKRDDSVTNNSQLIYSDCCLKEYTISTEYTKLGNNKTYKAFIYWYSAICFGFLPLILIGVFNSFLILAVYQSQKIRKKMSQENTKLKNENRITIMLIGVVILFLICQTPTASILIYENFYEMHNKNIKLALGNIFNFLITVNAACNFILYCVLSKKYRVIFKSMFCQIRYKIKKQQQQQPDTMMSTLTSSNLQMRTKRNNRDNLSTIRNLEAISLTSIPKNKKTLMVRPMGKTRSCDLVV